MYVDCVAASDCMILSDGQCCVSMDTDDPGFLKATFSVMFEFTFIT